MKEKIKKIFVEVPTIVLSVMIALAINEWNIQRERDNLAGKVIQTIREELEFNQQQVQKAYEYHLPLVENLSRGKHRMFSVPVKRLKLSSNSADELQAKISQLLEELGEAPEKLPVVKKVSDTLYRMQYKNQLLTLKFANDTMTVFGRGNISLRSAFIRNNAWRTAQAAQIAPYLDFKLISAMSELDQLHGNYQNTTAMIVDMLYKGGSDVTPAMQDMMYFEQQLLKKYESLSQLLNNDAP